MANIVVLASGSGSNFQAIAEFFSKNTHHRVSCVIYDRKKAFVRERAEQLDIPAHYVGYYQRDVHEAEQEIEAILLENRADLVVLAGFMRLLSSEMTGRWKKRIINIHPSLLPRHPGAHAIEKAYNAEEEQMGITIHWVDEGMDTGPVIRQESFLREKSESLDIIETKIHNLEHKYYPLVINEILERFRNHGLQSATS